MSINDIDYPGRNYRSFWYHNGILFIHDVHNNLVSITNPSVDPAVNRASLRSTEETRALFLPDSGYDLEGLTIDEQDRLFLYGEPATLDYQVFLEYWQEQHRAAGNDEVLEQLAGWPSRVSMRGTRYVGRDADRNWYWNDHMAMIVFSPQGELLDFFVFAEQKVSARPAVCPEGNIYVMHYAEESVDIYRVDRRW
ncbi:hypothetical protein [Spirochaeta africana]|nr:hypothetical protein [Spirochaeta africana]